MVEISNMGNQDQKDNKTICKNCLLVSQNIEIQSPKILYKITSIISELIKYNHLKQIEGLFSPADISPDKPWPDDIIMQKFKCIHCNQQYFLSVETYHGMGGQWKKI